VSPLASWAAVGGHGYLAASAEAEPPELSVPWEGGPMVPVWTENVVENPPELFVPWSEFNGFVQPTGTALPRTAIVGWLGALLHSAMPPSELAEYPEPETLTDCPLLSPESGVTVRVGPPA